MNRNKLLSRPIRSGIALATATSVLFSSAYYVDEAQAVANDSATPSLQERTLVAGAVAAASKKNEAVAEENQGIDWSRKLMANVKSTLNVRNLPGMHGDVISRMKPTDLADIVAYHGDWVEITSGNVTGYVAKEYTVTGAEVKKRYEEYSKTLAVPVVSQLNIRTTASTDSKVIGRLGRNEGIVIDEQAEEVEGWIGVKYGQQSGYVYGQYVEILEQELSVALTIEEEREKQLEEMAAQVSHRANVIYGDSVAYTEADEIMLAALLICEAGGSFDGMLAVGGVVVNRLKAGYASSLHGVIYQRGQFSPAGGSKMNSLIAQGATEQSRMAARTALSGIDITGGCKSFRAAWTGHYGTNIGGNVFF